MKSCAGFRLPQPTQFARPWSEASTFGSANLQIGDFRVKSLYYPAELFFLCDPLLGSLQIEANKCLAPRFECLDERTEQRQTTLQKLHVSCAFRSHSLCQFIDLVDFVFLV